MSSFRFVPMYHHRQLPNRIDHVAARRARSQNPRMLLKPRAPFGSIAEEWIENDDFRDQYARASSSPPVSVSTKLGQ